MNNDDRTPYVTRNIILKLLTDDDIAKVSTTETAGTGNAFSSGA